jgi:hypothetical protein
MIDPRPVVRDQFQPVPRLPDQCRVDFIGHGGHQDIRSFHRLAQFRAGHRRVIRAQRHMKQFRQSLFDDFRQPSRDYNT